MPHRQNTQHQKSENFAQKRDGAVYQFNIAAEAQKKNLPSHKYCLSVFICIHLLC